MTVAKVGKLRKATPSVLEREDSSERTEEERELNCAVAGRMSVSVAELRWLGTQAAARRAPAPRPQRALGKARGGHRAELTELNGC